LDESNKKGRVISIKKLLTLAVRSSHMRENPLAAGEQRMHAREAESESYRRPGNLSPACVSRNDGSQTSLAVKFSYFSLF